MKNVRTKKRKYTQRTLNKKNLIKKLSNETANELLNNAKKYESKIIELVQSLEDKKRKIFLTPNWKDTLFKSKESLSRKINKRLKSEIKKNKDKTNQDIQKRAQKIKNKITDYIRVTYIIPQKIYEKKILSLIDKLRQNNCIQLKPCKKQLRWELGDYYQGTNTVWQCPLQKSKIEVQFHTTESLKMKEKIHKKYEIHRVNCINNNGGIIKNRKCKTLRKQMLTMEKSVIIPKGLDVKKRFIRFDKNGKAYLSTE